MRVGIEVEAESNALTIGQVVEEIAGGTWVADRDGSLRGGATAFELKSAQPMDFSAAKRHLNELYPVLVGSSGSWRAAVHVHVDVLGLSWMRRALALSLAYACDMSLFTMFSPERVQSNFCVPLEHKSYAVLDCIRSMIEDHDVVRYGKYSSVNIGRMGDLGTIEFRHMRTPATDTTVSSVRSALWSIHNYVAACHRIVNACTMIPNDRYISTGDKLSGYFMRMLEWCNEDHDFQVRIDPSAAGEVLTVLAGIKPFNVTTLDLGSLVRVVPSQRPLRDDRDSVLLGDDGRARVRVHIGDEVRGMEFTGPEFEVFFEDEGGEE